MEAASSGRVMRSPKQQRGEDEAGDRLEEFDGAMRAMPPLARDKGGKTRNATHAVLRLGIPERRGQVGWAKRSVPTRGMGGDEVGAHSVKSMEVGRKLRVVARGASASV